MNIAVLGLGYVGHTVITSLLDRGCDRIDVAPLDTASGTIEQFERWVGQTRPSYPDASITLGQQIELAADSYDVCVLAMDAAASGEHLRINEAARRSGVPLIPAIGMGSVAHVGPIIGALDGPCLQCIEMRVQASRGQPAIVGPYPPDPNLLARAGHLAAELAVAVASDQSDTDNHFGVHYLWDHGGQTLSKALRVRTCTTCSLLAPAPAFTTQQQPLLTSGHAADKARIRELEDLIVDPVMGVVRSVQAYPACATEPQIEHAVASIADPIWAQYGQEVNGGGNDANPENAHAASLGEALDRVATTQPAEGQLIIASYDEVRDQAIDPARFNMFDKRTIDLPGFPYRQVGDHTPLSWTWGWSHERQSSVLVPASRVFIPMASSVPGDNQHHSNVTGCATGSSRLDAALGGLLEVAERDSFMIMWANQLEMTGVHIDPHGDTAAARYAAAFADVGIDVRCCYVELDWGVPLAIALAKSPHPGDPAVVIAASAEPDLASACTSALKELTANLAFVRPLVQGMRTPQLADRSAVRDQHSHALLYAQPAMAASLDAWWQPAQTVELPDPVSESSAASFERIADAAVASGADVISIDVSLPGLHQRGMFTYKVVAPGAYPMNFDSLWPELGGDRMRHAPVEAGLRCDPLAVSELCVTPHPFP